MLMNRMALRAANTRPKKKAGRLSSPRPGLPFSTYCVVFATVLAHESDDQRRSTVEAARLLAGVVVLRTLLAVADGAEPIRADAAADEIVAHRVGAAFAEREVVFRRADVAGVAFDLDADVGVLRPLQRRYRFVERADGFRPQAVPVEVEVHVLERDLRACRPHDLYVDGVARGLAVRRTGHGHRDGYRAFRVRRRPRRALRTAVGEGAGRRAP